MNASQPDIFGFLTYREYLSAVLLLLKKSKSGGLKELAKMAGFRSPSAVAMILAGKRRLHSDAAEKLAMSLPLDSSEQQYFLGLVKLEGAKTPTESFAIKEKLFLLKNRVKKSEMALGQYRVLAIWYYPAIYAMAASGELAYDCAAIAKRLGSDVSAGVVKSAVGDLLNLKLLEVRKGRLRQIHGPLTTADEVRSLAIHRYHESMLTKAKQALDRPLEQREFTGLTISVPPERVAEVKEKIRKFRKEVSESLTPAHAGSVYQLNLHFFPIAD